LWQVGEPENNSDITEDDNDANAPVTNKVTFLATTACLSHSLASKAVLQTFPTNCQAGAGQAPRYSKLPEGTVGEQFWQRREDDLPEIGPTVWAIIVPQVHVATFQAVATGGGRVAVVTAVGRSMWTTLSYLNLQRACLM